MNYPSSKRGLDHFDSMAAGFSLRSGHRVMMGSTKWRVGILPLFLTNNAALDEVAMAYGPVIRDLVLDPWWVPAFEISMREGYRLSYKITVLRFMLCFSMNRA